MIKNSESKFLVTHVRTVSEISETGTNSGTLEVEIFPSGNGKNIGEIIGKSGTKSCRLDRELSGLPYVIKGIGTSLSDRIAWNLRGNVDSDGKFKVFLTGLSTTMVQFKLSGELFGEDLVKKLGLELGPEIFTKKVFKTLAKYKTDNPDFQHYIEKMVHFWDNFNHFFNGANLEIESLRLEILELKRENFLIKNEILEIRKKIGIKNPLD